MLKKEKLTFHPISLDDRDWINEKLKEDHLDACEYTFANNFMWAKVYDVQVGEVCGCGVIRYREQENFEYSFPFGNGDKKAAVELLKGICTAHGHKLKLYPIVEKDRSELIKWFPGSFAIDLDRDDFDYIYTVEKLSSLRGKKLHGKRNHIARFMDDGDWRYEVMSEKNIDECRKMAKEWTAMRAEKWNKEMEQEIEVLEIAFANFRALDLVGGVLYKSGQIVAFTIGERLNSETFVVHFEKAFPDLQGAYPMINQQFVLHEAQDYRYVNREEDTGDLGLRKAKLSYYPDILLKKYCAIESHVVFANEYDMEAIVKLWQTCFGDDREYIEFYLKHRFTQENMLVIHENGSPVSMASMLPVQITMNGEKRSAKYVYAVATLPEYRQKGYAAEILKYAAGKYNEPLILQPADEKLCRYYAKLGFQEKFCESPCWSYDGACTKMTVVSQKQGHRELVQSSMEQQEPGNMLGKWAVSNADAKEYKAVRDQYFEKEGYVVWDEAALAYAIRENQFCNGKTLLLTQERDGSVCREVLMYRKEGSRLQVIETTLEDDAFYEILPELLAATGAAKALARNMGGMILLPESLKNWSCAEGGYLGLTLA